MGRGKKTPLCDRNVLFFVVILGLVLCCVFVVVRVGMGVILLFFEVSFFLPWGWVGGGGSRGPLYSLF